MTKHFTADVKEFNPGWRPKDAEDATLFEYMRTMAWLHDLARGGGAYSRWNKDPDEIRSRNFCSKTWALLRNARIVHLGHEALESALQAAEEWTWENIVGVRHDDFWSDRSGMYLDDSGKIVNGWMKKSVDAIGGAAPDALWPDNLPFENLYIGYGPGALLSGWRVVGKLHRCGVANVDHVQHLRVLGHLLTSRGECYEVTYLSIDDGNEALIIPNLRADDGLRWNKQFDWAPWAVPILVETINLHRTFVVTHELSDEQRQLYRKSRKEMGIKASQVGRPGHVPPPFYRLRLRDTVIVEDPFERAIRSLFPTTRALSYRHDRRGHERCYVRRGPLPLDSDRQSKLAADGFTVYASGTIDGTDATRLRERGLPLPNAGEWLAIKTRWIDATVIGDKSLPYVPAMRVAPRST